MISPFVINIIMAILWLLLQGGGLVNFLAGLVIGFILLYIFQSILQSRTYVRRVLAFFWFGWVFLTEFIKSNLSIAGSVLWSPIEEIHPNFITFDVTGMDRWEIFLLSQCITLTPGTTTVDLINEDRTLVVHAFDADDPDEVRRNIETSLKSAILRFSR
jgi:multicomponent Na+:H+ antiporter subunit E